MLCVLAKPSIICVLRYLNKQRVALTPSIWGQRQCSLEDSHWKLIVSLLTILIHYFSKVLEKWDLKLKVWSIIMYILCIIVVLCLIAKSYLTIIKQRKCQIRFFKKSICVVITSNVCNHLFHKPIFGNFILHVDFRSTVIYSC